MTTARTETVDRRSHLDARLHEIAWGLLLTMTGAMWLIPGNGVPEGTWLLGVAMVLLGVNAVRHFHHIPPNTVSLVLGVLALMGAISRLWRTDLPLLALCFIAIGGSLLAKPLLTRNG